MSSLCCIHGDYIQGTELTLTIILNVITHSTPLAHIQYAFNFFLHIASSLINVFEVVTMLTCIIYIMSKNVWGRRSSSLTHVGAVAIFTAWFNFTLLLGKLPSTGLYIQV